MTQTMRAGHYRHSIRHLLAKRIALHRAPRKPPGKGIWASAPISCSNAPELREGLKCLEQVGDAP